MASSRRLGINRGDPTAEVIRQLIPAAGGSSVSAARHSDGLELTQEEQSVNSGSRHG